MTMGYSASASTRTLIRAMNYPITRLPEAAFDPPGGSLNTISPVDFRAETRFLPAATRSRSVYAFRFAIKRGGQWIFGNMISRKNNFTREYTGAENKSPRDMEWPTMRNWIIQPAIWERVIKGTIIMPIQNYSHRKCSLQG